jgi:hypothetical protein
MIEQIKVDEVIVQFQGRTFKFDVFAINWEFMGRYGDPTITVEAQGQGRHKLRVELPSVAEPPPCMPIAEDQQ